MSTSNFNHLNGKKFNQICITNDWFVLIEIFVIKTNIKIMLCNSAFIFAICICKPQPIDAILQKASLECGFATW
jgi:hypothetical protein